MNHRSICVVFGVSVMAIAASAPVRADSFTYASSGLPNPESTVSFDGLSEDQDVGDAFQSQGATFQGLRATSEFLFPPSDGTMAANFDAASFGNIASTVSISFAKPVSAFSFFAVTDGGPTTVSGYLDGQLVESFDFADYRPEASYFGFTRTLIDSVSFNVGGDGALLIDNVAFGQAKYTSALPEPEAWAMMISGLGMVGGSLRRRARDGALLRATAAA